MVKHAKATKAPKQTEELVVKGNPVSASSSDDIEVESVKVKKSLLLRAVKALVELVNKKSANANPLFGASSETMCLYFTLSEIPNKRKIRPVMIPLPHPIYDGRSEVCFLSKDPQKTYKELLLQKHPVPGLTKVIGIDKLRKNYKTMQLKRQLADAFDLFLCDIAIAEALPKVLGKTFFRQKKKAPLPIRLRLANPEEHIIKAMSGTPLRIPSGPCLTIKVGHVAMSQEHLVSNAAAVIAHTMKHLQQRDNPIQSITIKTTDSPALPVWRRPRPAENFLDLRKYHSDAGSSAGSDTARSGASETGATSDSELVSDAGETLSTRDTISELDSVGEALSELDTLSELDSEAGDLDDAPTKEPLPLLKGLAGSKRRREGTVLAAAATAPPPKSSPKVAAKAAPEVEGHMPPPPPKKKKTKP